MRILHSAHFSAEKVTTRDVGADFSAEKTTSLRRRIKRLRVVFEVFVVQPGISKEKVDAEMTTMLGAAHNLIQDMTQAGLRVIASP